MPTQIITKRGLKLTVKEAELQCSLELRNNPDAFEDQRFIALKLAEIYEHGTEDINKNRRKAKRYLSQATDGTYVKPSFWSIDYIYSLLDAYNSSRVMLIRTNRFLVTFKIIAQAFLTRMFSIAGLYFFAQLAHLGYELAKEAYHAMPPLPENLSIPKRILNRIASFCQHFVTAFNSDRDRRSLIINDALWGSINLTLFLIATPYAVAINLIAFATDLTNAVFRHLGIQNTHDGLMEKMNTRIHEEEDNERALNNTIKALLTYEKQLQQRIQQYKAMGISISLEYAKKLAEELLDIQSQKKSKIDELVTCARTKNLLQDEKSKLTESKVNATKNKYISFTSGLLVFTGVALATIPGVNLILAAAGVCTLMAVSVYWFQRNAVAFLQKTYKVTESAERETATKQISTKIEQSKQEYDNILSKRSDAYVRARLSLIAKHQDTNEPAIKAEMRKNKNDNIAVLERTLHLSTELKSISSTLACLSKEEISTLQNIFQKTDILWSTHIESWIKNSETQSMVKQYINEPESHDCSFTQALQNRLMKERQDKLALDSSISADGRATLFAVAPAKKDQGSKTCKPSTYGTKALGM